MIARAIGEATGDAAGVRDRIPWFHGGLHVEKQEAIWNGNVVRGWFRTVHASALVAPEPDEFPVAGRFELQPAAIWSDHLLCMFDRPGKHQLVD